MMLAPLLSQHSSPDMTLDQLHVPAALWGSLDLESLFNPEMALTNLHTDTLAQVIPTTAATTTTIEQPQMHPQLTSQSEQETSSLPTTSPSSTHQIPTRPKRKAAAITPGDREDRARERTIRNRQAAQESRERKKLLNEELQAENARLRQSNASLASRLETIERSNQNLISRLDHLSSQLSLLVSANIQPFAPPPLPLQSGSSSSALPVLSSAYNNTTTTATTTTTTTASPLSESYSHSPQSIISSSPVSQRLATSDLTSSSTSPFTVTSLDVSTNPSIAHMTRLLFESQSHIGACESAVFADPQQWVPINGLTHPSTHPSSSTQTRLAWQTCLYLAQSLLPSLIAAARSLSQPQQTMCLPCRFSILTSSCEIVEDFTKLPVVSDCAISEEVVVQHHRIPVTFGRLREVSVGERIKGSSVSVPVPAWIGGGGGGGVVDVHDYVTLSHRKWRRQFPISSHILDSLSSFE
ncbi:hypothetical protein BSLG_000586 [Batrachochytrium salamandrivorans]|nr:hypothetical protein BSLG_000586 [Batrachochytrium salamandrivorans]